MGTSTAENLTSRFNTVDSKLNDLDTSINSVGTNLANDHIDLAASLGNVEGVIRNEVVSKIGNSTDNETNNTIFGKLFGINKKIDDLNTKTTNTNDKIEALSTKLGTSSDGNTVFGKLENLGTMVRQNSQKLDGITTTLNTVLNNTNLKTVNSATIKAMATAYKDYCTANPTASFEAKMEFITNFLHQRGYLN